MWEFKPWPKHSKNMSDYNYNYLLACGVVSIDLVELLI